MLCTQHMDHEFYLDHLGANKIKKKINRTSRDFKDLRKYGSM